MTSIEPSNTLAFLDVELSAYINLCPNIDFLNFVNDPVKCGPYQYITTDLKQPNIGLHALKPTWKSYCFLEYESWLCDILSILKSMDNSKARGNMEDQDIQELVRINQLKEIEWSGQQSKHNIMEGAVVNTGMLISSNACNSS